MIRLRKANGELQEQDSDWGFVEMCDSQGKVAFILYKDGPVYRMFGKQDKEAVNYSKVFKVDFIEHRPLELE